MDSGDTVTNVVSLQIKTVRLRDLLVLLDEVPQSQILNPSWLISTIFVQTLFHFLAGRIHQGRHIKAKRIRISSKGLRLNTC